MSSILSLQDVRLDVNRKTILSNISLDIKTGRHTAIIGKNGAGKSFLLRTICGEHFPTTGVVTLLGKKLGTYDIWRLRTHIGIVSDRLQKEYFSGSTVENVIAAGFFASNGLFDEITPAMREKIEEIIEFLEIKHLRGRRFGELSHGEQRRTLIGRALVNNPELLLLDEPCTGLDIASREEFLTTLSKIAQEQKTTILFVSHHLEEIIPQIQDIVFIKEGKVFAQGKKEIMFTEKMLSDVFDHPVRLFEQDGRFFPRPGAS
ncbi:MAG: ATP-binding cassette domain-containing protein [Spirochaetales bacterium]|nr:ATP-binding cassette domain-containing protein [Spirochaetales bacterium]